MTEVRAAGEQGVKAGAADGAEEEQGDRGNEADNRATEGGGSRCEGERFRVRELPFYS